MTFLILLSGSVRVSAQNLNIFVFGKSNSKTAGQIESILENEIQDRLKDQYPCASTLTNEDAATLLGWARERELMGNKDEDAIPSVSVDGDEYTITFMVPEIDDGIGVRDWTLEDSGRRGSHYSNHESNSVKWTSPELYEQVKGKIDHSKPDVLAGNQTVSRGSPLAPSMEQTTIITWNLNFKRDPSTKN